MAPKASLLDSATQDNPPACPIIEVMSSVCPHGNSLRLKAGKASGTTSGKASGTPVDLTPMMHKPSFVALSPYHISVNQEMCIFVSRLHHSHPGAVFTLRECSGHDSVTIFPRHFHRPSTALPTCYLEENSRLHLKQADGRGEKFASRQAPVFSAPSIQTVICPCGVERKPRHNTWCAPAPNPGVHRFGRQHC